MRPAAAACKNFAVRILLPAVVVCAGLWMTAVPALAQRPLETVQTPSTTPQAEKPFVEHIEFYGNQTYPRDMLLARIFTRVGDQRRARRDQRDPQLADVDPRARGQLEVPLKERVRFPKERQNGGLTVLSHMVLLDRLWAIPLAGSASSGPVCPKHYI